MTVVCTGNPLTCPRSPDPDCRKSAVGTPPFSRVIWHRWRQTCGMLPVIWPVWRQRSGFRLREPQNALVGRARFELADDVLLGAMGIGPGGEPVPDESGKRRRRATAIAAVAIVAVAAAGIVYLKSASTLRTETSVTPTPPAGPHPVTYSFVTPTLR